MAKIVYLDLHDEYYSFEEFIQQNALQKEFNKTETIDFEDYDPDYIQDKYDGDTMAVQEYIKKFWKGTWYVVWSELNDDYFNVYKIISD